MKYRKLKTETNDQPRQMLHCEDDAKSSQGNGDQSSDHHLSMYVSRNHTDWHVTLPFVRFAYNTSKQESTGKSPIYLMHGRHPVLPIDAICGADPDPKQLVRVESRGLGNFETWMLGNLQRAFAEVDAPNQKAQRRYKRHYDETRQEGEMHNPGQKVLVYRPTRKIVLADKLLHRWHGPYVVQQQITPLNYEIRLISGKKNTKIVHVERLKFTDTIRMDQGVEQADTNNKDTPSPSKEPARKSVRFEHHATEDDSADQEEPTTTPNIERNGNPIDPVADVPPTHDIAQTELETDGEGTTPETGQQTEETPRQQPDAQPDEQTRRYPLRIRRNRFALASTLLCGLLTTLTMKPELTQATTSNGMAHHPT